MAFRVMRARPPKQFTLTDIGYTPAEWLVKKKKLARALKSLGVEWWLSIEVSPEHRMPHAHGFLKGQITESQFKAAAFAAGFGISDLKTVPSYRTNQPNHFAYPMKSLDAPEIRDEFLKWNAKGSKVGFESHSRGFFKTSLVDAIRNA
jgi:hypothetical protein